MENLIYLYKLVCCISDSKFPNPYHFEFGRNEAIAKNK
jgi:hypothetical protein